MAIPGTISHYRVVRKLGEGGMGEVYLASDTRLERSVALKILPSGVSSDPDRLARFSRKARAAGAINHPNVAHIYETSEAEGVTFIAMEYVEGEPLASRQVELAHCLVELASSLTWTMSWGSTIFENLQGRYFASQST